MTQPHLLDRRQTLAGLAGVAAAGLAGNARAAAALPKHIIDGQVHIWRPGGPQPSPTGRQEPHSTDQLLATLDSGGVERAVIVTPSWNPDQNLYPLEAAQQHPDRLRVMGLYFDWNKPANPDQIENWMKPQGMAGIRMFLGLEPGMKWLTSSDSDWIWPILERRNIPLMIGAPAATARITEIAARHPGLKICLDSFGVPGTTNAAQSFAKYADVLAMAKLPNIIVKCASVPFLSNDPYPYANMKGYVKQAFDAFGPERLIYASDITLLKGTYKDCVNFWTELEWLTDKDRAAIMGGNIAKWLNWPLPA